MANKIKLTRPELKRQRDMLGRFERYLPMLKLKQQQLQVTLRDIEIRHRQAQRDVSGARERFVPYERLLNDRSGVNVRGMSKPQQVETSTRNIAGVTIPILEDVKFPPVTYSLFATPVWVDKTLEALREISRLVARADILSQQYELLQEELTKIIQRVNRVNSRTQQVDYYFQLTMTNLDDGLAYWEGEYPIVKRGDNRTVTW